MNTKFKVDNAILEKKDERNHLVDSIGEAYLLLRYGIKQGIDIDENIIQSIVQSRSLLNSSASQVTSEISFWNAFKVLTEKIKPITIASLKSTKENCVPRDNNSIFCFFGEYKIPSARKASYIYQIITLIFIIFIVVVQAYATIGKNSIIELDSLFIKINDQKELLKKIPEKDRVTSTDYQNGKQNSEKLVGNLRQTGLLLEKWQSILNISSEDKNNNESNIKDCDFECLDPTIKQFITISQTILLAIYSYILPLLYGFLGASAYILRNLALEIKSLTYTNDLIIHYNLRIALGMLSGLAIGLFYNDPTKQGDISFTTSLSPLALAFLAGYSVEILFATMDRVIAGFSADKSIKSN